MTKEQQKNNLDALQADCDRVMLRKGESYASTDDTLASFKRAAERTGLTMFQIWQVYFNKHVDSINNAIKTSPHFPQDESEGMNSRIVDIINYARFLSLLIVEKSGANGETL